MSPIVCTYDVPMSLYLMGYHFRSQDTFQPVPFGTQHSTGLGGLGGLGDGAPPGFGAICCLAKVHMFVWSQLYLARLDFICDAFFDNCEFFLVT